MLRTSCLLALCLGAGLSAAEGGLDIAFGSGGFATIEQSGDDQVADLLRRPDGRIVVAGSSSTAGQSAVLLGRVLNDGQSDTTFGDRGRRLLARNGSLGDVAESLLATERGLVVVGRAEDSSSSASSLVLGLDADGDVDLGFGSAGVLQRALGPGLESWTSVAAQSDGRLICAGWLERDGQRRLAIGRIASDGSWDESFNSGAGLQELLVDDYAVVRDLVVTSADQIVLVGAAGTTATATRVIAARLHADGQLDTTFGSDGIAEPALAASGSSGAEAVIVDDDGYLLTGYAPDGSTSAVLIMRLLADGNLDTDFGDQGMGIFGSFGNLVGYDLVRQSDDKILVVGEDDVVGFTMRLLADGSDVDEDFGWRGLAGFETLKLARIRSATPTPDDARLLVGASGEGELRIAQVIIGERAAQPPSLVGGPNYAVTMDEDGDPEAFALTLSATDADTPAADLHWSIGESPAHGSAAVGDPATGGSMAIAYQPTANYAGEDSFTVVVSDGQATDTAWVTVTIRERPDPEPRAPELIISRAGSTISPGGSDDLPALTVDETATLTYQLQNSGDADLQIQAIASADSQGLQVDLLTPSTTILAPSASVDLGVVCRGLSAGSASVTITIDSDDPAQPTYDWQIAGTVGLSEPPPAASRRLLFQVSPAKAVDGLEFRYEAATPPAEEPTIDHITGGRRIDGLRPDSDHELGFVVPSGPG